MEDDPVVEIAETLIAGFERLERSVEKLEPKQPMVNQTTIVTALILMFFGFVFGLPAYSRKYHDDNTPAPTTEQSITELQRRMMNAERRIEGHQEDGHGTRGGDS